MTKQSPLGFSTYVYDNANVDRHYQRRHKEHDKDFNPCQLYKMIVAVQS